MSSAAKFKDWLAAHRLAIKTRTKPGFVWTFAPPDMDASGKAPFHLAATELKSPNGDKTHILMAMIDAPKCSGIVFSIGTDKQALSRNFALFAVWHEKYYDYLTSKIAIIASGPEPPFKLDGFIPMPNAQLVGAREPITHRQFCPAPECEQHSYAY